MGSGGRTRRVPRGGTLFALLLLACGASSKRELDARSTCPSLEIPSEGTEQAYREYLLSLRTRQACAEQWEATILMHIQEVAVQKDEGTNGARFIELGQRVDRCSLEARQCFVPIKVKRGLPGFHHISASVTHKRLDHSMSLDLVRDGAIGADGRFMNCQHGEACELPVDLLDLLRAPRGVVWVDAVTRETPEEIAHRKAEEARLEEERFNACFEECFARSNALLEPPLQHPLSKIFLRWYDRTERKKCRVGCMPPVGAPASE